MAQKIASNKKTLNVAVVGATGAVGLEMIRMLQERSFPVKNLRLFASERSSGKEISFNRHKIKVEALNEKSVAELDLAIFSAGATLSRQYAPLFAKAGVFVVDNSSAWRMDPAIPLVVPEVNPHDLSADKKIIANPNCSTIQMVLALSPLHKKAVIKRVRVATYQSVSGAGGKGIQDLENQVKAWAKGQPIPTSFKFSQQIAFNVIPHIDVFQEDDYTKEELKMTNETQKILGDPSILVSATCVRVPVFRAHSEAVWVEFEKPLSPVQAKEILRSAPGIQIVDEPSNSKYPTPLEASSRGETFVGRIRKDLSDPNGLVFWVVSDNLLKGAALNAVQIAEKLVEMGYLG